MLASVKYVMPRRWNWASRFDVAWLQKQGVYRLTGTVRWWPATPEVNDVGEPCAGEPHARFDRGPLARRPPMAWWKTHPKGNPTD